MAVGAKLNQVWGGWGVANLGTDTLLIMMTTYNDDDNYENYVEDDDDEEDDVNAWNGDDGVKVWPACIHTGSRCLNTEEGAEVQTQWW